MLLWVGKELMFDFPVVILFCIYFYILKMGDIRGTYSDAIGLWWENRYRAAIETLTNLLLNAILVQVMGIYGIILATLVSLFIVNFIFGSQIIFKYYFKKNSIKEYYGQHGKYAFFTIINAIITYFVVSTIRLDGILGLLIKLIVCSIISIGLYLISYIRDPMFRKILNWIMEKI
jgi:hypothetical protein